MSSRAVKNILIVDDDRTTRMVVRKALESGGKGAYTVHEAADGPACLLLVTRRRAFDLILLDVELPGMGGFDVCRALRRIDPEVPVVFVTAHGELETRLAGREAGGTSFLPKPVPPASLLALVGNLTAAK